MRFFRFITYILFLKSISCYAQGLNDTTNFIKNKIVQNDYILICAVDVSGYSIVRLPYKIKSIRVLNYETKEEYFSIRNIDIHRNISIDSVLEMHSCVNEFNVDSVDVKKVEEIFSHREYICKIHSFFTNLLEIGWQSHSKIPNKFRSRNNKNYCFMELSLNEDCGYTKIVIAIHHKGHTILDYSDYTKYRITDTQHRNWLVNFVKKYR